MKRSTDRILTTHVGSLIRPPAVIKGMKARTLGQPYDEAKFTEDIRSSIIDVVHKQAEIGVDVVNDGEFNRRGFTTYIHERLGGIEPRVLAAGERNPLDQIGHDLERHEFPEFYAQHDKHYRFLWMHPEVPMDDMANIRGKSEIFRLTAPITYKPAVVTRDIETLKAARAGTKVEDIFITAVTPTTERKDTDVDKFYPNTSAYRYALADALHEEYKAITDAGFVLQLDRAAQNPVLNLPDDQILTELEKGIEVVNHALRGIPPEMVRSHWCGGSGNRPHTQNIPLKKIIPAMLKLNVSAYGFEAANPRHEHEFMIWQDVKLPDGKMIVPGLVSQSTNVVEHPELVAWRIRNFANLVGKENIIAGTDCGFSQDWDLIRVHETIQWAKLQALVDGAALASKQLWSKPAHVR